MNGYVNIENKYSDAILKFAVSDSEETTVVGIYKYLVGILSINKLFVAHGSFIDHTSSKNEYNLVFNIMKNSDESIIITVLFGNILIGVIATSDDKISKIGG